MNDLTTLEQDNARLRADAVVCQAGCTSHMAN